MKASTIFPKILKGALAALFWLGVWYLLAAVISKPLFLPYPHDVLKRLFELAVTAPFWKTVALSSARIVWGWLLGLVIGGALALLTHFVRFADIIISPALRTVRAVPVVSFILLMFLWMSNDAIPVFIALLMVVPIVWQNTASGLAALDKNLSEMATVFRFSRALTLKKVIFPQLAPYLYSASLTSLGLAWKSGIAAEVISYPAVAIGAEMNAAKVSIETVDLFVWTVTVVAVSLIFEGIFRLILKRGGKKG